MVENEYISYLGRVYYAGRTCQDQTAAKKYRRVFVELLLIPNRYLPGAIIEQLLPMGRHDDYSINTAKSTINRMCTQGVLSRSERIYYNRYTLYSLTPDGVEDALKIISSLKLYYNTTDIGDFENGIRNIYKSHRRDIYKVHNVAVSIMYALLIRIIPSTDYRLERNLNYSPEMMKCYKRRKNDEKNAEESEAASDICLFPGTKGNSPTFFDAIIVDEQKKPVKCFESKINTYIKYANELKKTNPCASIQLISAVFDDGWVPDMKEGELFTLEEKKILSGNLYPLYFQIALLEVAATLAYPNKKLTIEDLINLLTRASAMLTRNVYSSKSTQYDNLLTVLKAISRIYCDTAEGQMLSGSIRDKIEDALKKDTPNQERLFYKHNVEVAEVYKHKITQKIYQSIENEGTEKSSIWNVLRNGMLYAVVPGRNFYYNMIYLMPELYFRKYLSRIMFNIGITHDQELISEIKCIPLCNELKKDDYNNQRYYSNYMRRTFKIGNTYVCIENISDDIGGLIRAKEYLRLPPSSLNNVFLLLLVNNQKILADGTSVENGTLYCEKFVTDSDCKFISYDNVTINKVLDYYYRAFWTFNKGISTATGSYLPYYHSVSQDFAILTYDEFRRAIKEHVDPWIPIMKKEKFMLIKRRILPKDAVEVPAVPQKFVMDNKEATDLKKWFNAYERKNQNESGECF